MATDKALQYLDITLQGDSDSITDTGENVLTISADKSKLGGTVTITTQADPGYTVGDVAVTYASGREVAVTDNGDGTYRYLQPGAEPEKEPGKEPELPQTVSFTDVSADDWCYDAVQWAVENHITSGTGNGSTFGGNQPCTRAQIVTFLYRALGA